MTEIGTVVKTQGALCSACHQRMLVARGCVLVKVPIYGGPQQRGKRRKVLKTLNPIKYGQETRYGDIEHSKQRCHDCGALPGNYHHPGCDWEECPNCHTQMLMCGGECGVPQQ